MLSSFATGAARAARAPARRVAAAASAPLSSATPEPSYSERMAAKYPNRPVSPHVMIYSFPIVALSSITVRVTGVGLSLGLTGMASAALVGADVPALMQAVAMPATKFIVAFPLVYHYIGGLRHTIWDRQPETVTNEAVEKASMALFGASTVISGGLALVSLAPL